jgi:hypothetical protein
MSPLPFGRGRGKIGERSYPLTRALVPKGRTAKKGYGINIVLLQSGTFAKTVTPVFKVRLFNNVF